MEKSANRIRSEVLSRLKYGITHKESNERISSNLVNDLASRLVLVDSADERRSLIKSWYHDLKGADLIRKHHLNYNHPALNRELSIALNDVTIRFKQRFRNYFS